MDRVQREKSVLGTVAVALVKFTFYFATATYLLAAPVTYFTIGGDALLPYESAICILLSSAFYIESGKQAWSIFK